MDTTSIVGHFCPTAVILLMLFLNGVTAITQVSIVRDNSTDCVQRGFAGSTLNKCGYCVGGRTGLSPDYGLDCAGTCGIAFTDCAGTCNGDSYQDECTRECISGRMLANVKTSSKDQTRDCRGLCTLDGDKLDFEFVPDECNICIGQSRKERFASTSDRTTTRERPLKGKHGGLNSTSNKRAAPNNALPAAGRAASEFNATGSTNSSLSMPTKSPFDRKTRTTRATFTTTTTTTEDPSMTTDIPEIEDSTSTSRAEKTSSNRFGLSTSPSYSYTTGEDSVTESPTTATLGQHSSTNGSAGKTLPSATTAHRPTKTTAAGKFASKTTTSGHFTPARTTTSTTTTVPEDEFSPNFNSSQSSSKSTPSNHTSPSNRTTTGSHQKSTTSMRFGKKGTTTTTTTSSSFESKGATESPFATNRSTAGYNYHSTGTTPSYDYNNLTIPTYTSPSSSIPVYNQSTSQTSKHNVTTPAMTTNRHTSSPTATTTAPTLSYQTGTSEMQTTPQVSNTTAAGSFNVTGTHTTSSTLYTELPPNYSNSSIKSVFKDCTGTCYTPALSRSMAIVSNETCNQCVPISSGTANSLHNECGRCLPDPEPCLCPMTQMDACGVCSGQNNTCTTIVSAYPTNIPSDTETKINAVGVTLMSKYHSVCLLIRRDIEPDGRDEWKFPAELSGTSITCTITAPQGLYNFHLGVLKENGDILTFSNKSLPFLVYSKSAVIRSMSPTTAVIPKATDNSNNHQLIVSFDAAELQRIDTMYCTIYGDGYSEPTVIMTKNVTANQVTCSVPFSIHSSMANVNLSLDLGPMGFLGGPFPLTLYASSPSITRFIPLPEGDRLAIFFDLDVGSATTNATSTNCSHVFAAKSISTLGENSTCVWVTRRQLMVAFGESMPPVNGPNAASNDSTNVTLYFNDKSIYPDYENYTQPTTNLSIAFKLADDPPLAILVGPSGMVPLCGDFILDGHQSAGLQTRRAIYVWSVAIVNASSSNSTSVSTKDQMNSTNEDFKNLTRLLKEATTANMASVIVQTSDMDFDVEYAFSLTVSNGPTSISPTSTSTLVIVRSRDPLPSLFIEPSVVQYGKRVSVDSRFTLSAQLDMPLCIRELYSIHFQWATPNPKVKFDILQMNSSSYTVEPYTLPTNENVTFEFKVWLNNNLNLSSKASISFEVKAPEVRAVITGGKRRSLGVNSGTLQLNASTSHHSTIRNLPLVYRWECLTTNNNPCYNYDSLVKDTQLIASPIDRKGVLSVPTNRLRVNDEMTFGLRAISPTNASDISNAQTVVIHVTNDSAPLVTIDQIVSKKSDASQPIVDEKMLYHVTSDVNVEIVATVNSTSGPIASIKWEIPGFTRDLNQYSLREDLSQGDKNWTARSSLVIRKDFLVANGLYEINVTATNEQGHVGWSTSEFVVESPVSNCKVTVDEYEAFTMTYVYVEGCTASQRSYPLRYSAFVYTKGLPMSISQAGFHLPMSIMGPPSMPSAARVSSDGCGKIEYFNDSSNMFAVEVCDAFNNCWLFNSSRTFVRSAKDMQAAAGHAFAMANIAKLTDNYLGCLRRHAFYLMEASTNPSYLAENELEFQSQLAQAYVCARKAAERQCSDASCFANLFTFLTAIPIDTRTSREFMLTEVLERALDRIESQNITLNADGVQEAYIVLENVYRFNVSDNVTALTAATMEDRFTRILARSLAIGESPILIDSFGHPVVAMAYDGLNSTLEVVTNGTANNSVSVLFGSDFKSKYHAWDCQQDGTLCRGVVAELQFYPDHVFRSIHVDDRPNRTVSEVISAALLNPATGQMVNDRQGSVVLTVPVDRSRMSQDLDYECHFWDADEEAWSTDGMKTSDGGGKTLDCEADHLATFVIIGSEPTMSAWVIAVIVVSCVLVLLLVAGGGFYFYRKSRTKTMRVSIGRSGYHPNSQ